MKLRRPSNWEKLLALVVGVSLGILFSTSAKADLDSTYEKYSRSAKALYAAHELNKY